MKKYIVLSVNDNVDYLYFTPLTCWAWRQFGWEPIVMYHQSNKSEKLSELEELTINTGMLGINTIKFLKSIEGYRSDTITQISRLYSSCIVEYGYLMTGDIDMIPLSDYWKPSPDKITVYGHDLTGFGHYPICYIGMMSGQWDEVMGLESITDYNAAIKHDLDTLPQAKDLDFYKFWFSDQDLITQRLNDYGKDKITFINRGKNPKHTDYAFGRVDRGSWSLDHEQLIDAHLMQQTHHDQNKIDKLMELLKHVWPNEDFTWLVEYTKEFKRLAV